MTRAERETALRLLDKVEAAVPVRPATIEARVSARALREILTKAHAAEKPTPPASGAPA